VNLVHGNFQATVENPILVSQIPSVSYSSPKHPNPSIDRSEFESLLERAQEILNARAKSAFSPHA